MGSHRKERRLPIIRDFASRWGLAFMVTSHSRSILETEQRFVLPRVRSNLDTTAAGNQTQCLV